MRNILLSFMLGATMSITAQNITKPAIPRDAVIEEKIEKQLAKMTLDEKVGQMLELNLDLMGKMVQENAKVSREKVRLVLKGFGTSDKDIDALVKLSDKEITNRLGNYNLDIYEGNGKSNWQLNETMLDTIISKYKIGSILNAPGTRAATVAQWQNWIQLIQKKSMKYIGIPDIYGLDHNHGRYPIPPAHQSRRIFQHGTCQERSRDNGIRKPCRKLPLGI